MTAPAPDGQLLLLYGGGAGEVFCSRVQLHSSSSSSSSSSSIELKPSVSPAFELRDRGHIRTIFTIRARADGDGVQAVGLLCDVQPAAVV